MIHFDQNAPNPRLPVLWDARFCPNAPRETEGANGLQTLYPCGFAGGGMQCKNRPFAHSNTQTRPRLNRRGAALLLRKQRIYRDSEFRVTEEARGR